MSIIMACFFFSAISEIHCGDQEELNLDGYKSIISTRPKAPKHSGGIPILIKNKNIPRHY